MDGAQACYPYLAVGVRATRRRVGGRGGREEARAATPGGTASGADLGGSSKYSSGSLEGRSGERFRGNSSWTRVSRS